MTILKEQEWHPQRHCREGGGQCSKRASPGEGEMQARIPVILQSLDGLRPVDLRLLHNELDVILTHICMGG